MTQRFRLLAVAGAASIIFIGVGAWVGLRYFSGQSNKVLTTTISGVSFNHSERLKPETITDEDKEDGIIARLNPTGSKTPQMLVTIRQEGDIRAVAIAIKQQPLDLLLSNMEKVYPSRFTEYKKLGERRFNQSNRPAAEVYFEYKGPSGDKIQQRLLLVMMGDDRVIYVAGQSKQSEYEQINKDYFNLIFESIKL